MWLQDNPVDADLLNFVYAASVGMGNASAWDSMRQYFLTVSTAHAAWTCLSTGLDLHAQDG